MDAKPEVQNLAKMGMTTYLVFKPIEELNTLSTAYVKNCNAYAEREKKRRKAEANGGAIVEKPEKSYVITIMMAACMILSFPYDLPEYAPALLHALIRHISVPSLKDTVILL